MKLFVGVTDTGWYRYLAARPDLTEVNFWRPSGVGFRSLVPGEPFAFKSHSPHNRIVGGGFFDGYVRMPVSDAWRIFGEANGVASIEQLRAAISRNRREPLGPLDDPEVGCIMLRGVAFLREDETLPAPVDWSWNIVSGKTYDAASVEAGPILEGLFAHLLVSEIDSPAMVSGPVFGAQRLVYVRHGQKPFQALVLDAYHRRCAITGERIRPVLDAAHIVPVTKGGENRVDNGLLLRSDVHTLFDAGYIGIDPKHRLMVSPRLRAEFENGDYFYRHAGTTIALPDRRADRPNRAFLEWHLDTVFQGA